jgi:hypothetical protein
MRAYLKRELLSTSSKPIEKRSCIHLFFAIPLQELKL